MSFELVAKNTIYKSLRSNEKVDVTNGSFLSTSSKTDVVLHSMTTKNKKRYEEVNQIDVSKLFCIKEKESCSSIFT